MPGQTVFDAKRLIGRKYTEVCLQEDIKHWPFEVVDVDGRPKVRVEYGGEHKEFVIFINLIPQYGRELNICFRPHRKFLG